MPPPPLEVSPPAPAVTEPRRKRQSRGASTQESSPSQTPAVTDAGGAALRTSAAASASAPALTSALPPGVGLEALDDRQRQDLELLVSAARKAPAVGSKARASSAARVRSAFDEGGPSDFKELLRRFREGEDRALRRDFAGKSGEEQTCTLRELQRLVWGMVGQVDKMEHDLESVATALKTSETALAESGQKLEQEIDKRQQAEQDLSSARQRVEELELEMLSVEAEREQWRQREAELHHVASEGDSLRQDLEARDRSELAARDDRIHKLEALLREAIRRGAKLGKALAGSEKASAEAEKRLTRLREAAKAKIRRERKRSEAALRHAERRADHAEHRLGEYLAAGIEGADALAEAHMLHLMEVGQHLSHKVDEQADIIEALNGLLQDHKEFIRREMGRDRGSVAAAPPPLEPWRPSDGCSAREAIPTGGYNDDMEDLAASLSEGGDVASDGELEGDAPRSQGVAQRLAA